MRPLGLGNKRKMDEAVMDLPLPDSPTTPRLRPVSSENVTPFTALLTPRRLTR